MCTERDGWLTKWKGHEISKNSYRKLNWIIDKEYYGVIAFFYKMLKIMHETISSNGIDD